MLLRSFFKPRAIRHVQIIDRNEIRARFGVGTPLAAVCTILAYIRQPLLDWLE